MPAERVGESEQDAQVRRMAEVFISQQIKVAARCGVSYELMRQLINIEEEKANANSLSTAG